MSRKVAHQRTRDVAESRRERERRARLELIRGAAARVFAGHGYDNATMEMVAREAELGKATLYYYFETKHQLFDDIVSTAAGTLSELADRNLGERRDGAAAAAGLEALARILTTFFREHADLAVLLLPLHATGHRGVDQRIDASTARAVMRAHAPLLEILEPYGAELDGGEALPGLVGSFLLGLAAKAHHGETAHLDREVELLCNLLRRIDAEE